MEKQQILILGNGFDLASGLPTLYSKYFNDFELENSKLFNRLNELRRIFRDHYRIVKAGSVSELMDDTEVIILVNEIVNIVYESRISIWSLNFWLSETNKYRNWSDIEVRIENNVKMKDPFIDRANINTNAEENKCFIFLKHLLTEGKIVDSLLLYNEIPSTADFLMVALICQKVITKREYIEKDFNMLLFMELKLLEKDFKLYIEIISNNINDNISEVDGEFKKKTSFRNKYRDNLVHLVDDNFRNVFLLNFNYTNFSHPVVSDDFEIRRGNKVYYINQNNIHGVYSSDIILGIDKSTMSTEDNYYLFTKTYRKMEMYDSINSNPLPSKASVKLISFFGHSLSKADYSYFKSIFDYYDIYSSGVRIEFLFSYYSDSRYTLENQTNRIRQALFTNVTKLLDKYGSEMSDKGYGKNLTHKLLLENRLIYREVTLKEIDYKKALEKSLSPGLYSDYKEDPDRVTKKYVQNGKKLTSDEIVDFFILVVNKAIESVLEYYEISEKTNDIYLRDSDTVFNYFKKTILLLDKIGKLSVKVQIMDFKNKYTLLSIGYKEGEMEYKPSAKISVLETSVGEVHFDILYSKSVALYNTLYIIVYFLKDTHLAEELKEKLSDLD